MPVLPDVFLRRPIAHRALHDAQDGRLENSRAAILAAIDHDYGIEIDLQLSADGHAMVFHDYHLDHLTDAQGAVRDRSATELANVRLNHCGEGVPTLPEVLDLVRGKVPLLIEIKDQDGALGEGVGPLEAATAKALHGYPGAAAVMSFNPFAVAEMARLCPDLPRGLTTSRFRTESWPRVPDATLTRLRDIPDFKATGASFVSHDWRDLDRPAITALHSGGVPILCWTVRSPQDAATARIRADNITFEGFAA